jgi:Trypsin-like peptidase domain
MKNYSYLQVLFITILGSFFSASYVKAEEILKTDVNTPLTSGNYQRPIIIAEKINLDVCQQAPKSILCEIRRSQENRRIQLEKEEREREELRQRKLEEKAMEIPGVPEIPTDQDWKSPNSKIPWSRIVKLKSDFDGNVDYAIFDRDWTKRDGEEVGFVTKWTSDSIQGLIYKTDCGANFCIGTRIKSIVDMPSPIVLRLGEQEYKIYGDEGTFNIPSSFLKKIVESSGKPSLKIKIGESGMILPIGQNTVESLKTLYSRISLRQKAPDFNLQAVPIVDGNSFQKLVAASLNKVVMIRAGGSLGTGFIAENSGLIMTNRHVVRSYRTVDISYADGTKTIAQVIFRDREKDLAIIRPSKPSVTGSLPLCYAIYPKPGEEVFALGSPLGLANTVTKGIASSVRISEADSKSIIPEGSTLIQTDAAVSPGNSGGPLLNNRGEVIGMITFKRTAGEGLNFAVSIIDLLNAIEAQRPTIPDGQAATECGNLIPIANKDTR